MTPLLVLIVAYSAGLVAVGWWMGRNVRASADFFVAGRSLGPGLVCATFLAANIGAASSVGATGLAYRNGLAAWWWNGSAGLGSLALAFWVGPRMWRLAERFKFLTVGDYLEHYFGRGVRGLAATIIWAGSLAVLCGQLKGAAEVLNGAAGVPLGYGALIATVVTVSYFVLGGLRSAVWVNVVQLLVISVGFALAVPFVSQAAGGGLLADGRSSFWSGTGVGWTTLFLLGPAFFLSPGLIQKSYGARDPRSLTRGVAANGLVLMLFAALPVALGMAARMLHPDLPRREMALPVVLASHTPLGVGSLALAAVFSAEISTADAVLFMLATTGARDLYRGFLRPAASDAEVLRVARILSLTGGLVGFGLTFVFDSVISALTLFYQLMVVTLFAPILGGLLLPRAGRWGALTAMLVGMATFAVTYIATGGTGYGWAEPYFLGMIASAGAYFLLAIF